MIVPRLNRQLASHLRKTAFVPTINQRSFSLTATATDKSDVKEPVVQLSNAFKNQHIKYIPSKKFIFDIATNEGRMTKIFQSDNLKLDRNS